MMLGLGRASGSAALKKWTCVSICEHELQDVVLDNMIVLSQDRNHQREAKTIWTIKLR